MQKALPKGVNHAEQQADSIPQIDERLSWVVLQSDELKESSKHIKPTDIDATNHATTFHSA
jgi:hypothetical protein